jgi:hypothetical protein
MPKVYSPQEKASTKVDRFDMSTSVEMASSLPRQRAEAKNCRGAKGDAEYSDDDNGFDRDDKYFETKRYS